VRLLPVIVDWTLLLPWLTFSLRIQLCSAVSAEEQGKAKSGRVTVTGCLQKGSEANAFYMTDDNSQMWELSQLGEARPAFGHKVTVAGVEVKKSRGEEAKKEGTRRPKWTGRRTAT
jgi:hypothetical protein